MAEVIRMPRMSDTMTEGIIVEWHKKVGDKVKSGDLLAEVETDKATMELESYHDGILLYIGVEKGKPAQVDGILAVIGNAGEDFETALAAAKNAAPKAQPAVVTEEKTAAVASSAATKVALPAGAHEIRMPLLSDTMTEGKIIAWNKKIGDDVKSDDVLADVETDKATMEVVGYEEGTLLYIGVEAGSAAKINEIIAIVGKKGTDVSAYVAAEKSGANSATVNISQPTAAAATATAAQPTQDTEPDVFDSSNERIKASPLAKKLAADKAIYDASASAALGDKTGAAIMAFTVAT